MAISKRDLATLISPDSTVNERLAAAAFTFVKPLKVADNGHDLLKGGEMTKNADKGTGKSNSTKDIYKVAPKEVQQALEGYEQTSKFNAHFKDFEVKAQRLLSNMSDKQLIYSFKNGYAPKDGVNDTIYFIIMNKELRDQ